MTIENGTKPDLYWGRTANQKALNMLEAAERKEKRHAHIPTYAGLKEPIEYDSEGHPLNIPRRIIKIVDLKEELKKVFQNRTYEDEIEEVDEGVKIPVINPCTPCLFTPEGAMLIHDIISGDTLYSVGKRAGTLYTFKQLEDLPDQDIVKSTKRRKHVFDKEKAVEHGPYKVDSAHQTCLRPDGQTVYLSRQLFQLLLFLKTDRARSLADISISGCINTKGKQSEFRLGNVISDLRNIIGKDAIILERNKGWRLNPSPDHTEIKNSDIEQTQ